MPPKRRGRTRRQSSRLQAIDPSTTDYSHNSPAAEPSSKNTSNDQLDEAMEYDEQMEANKKLLVKRGGHSKKGDCLENDANAKDADPAVDDKPSELHPDLDGTDLECQSKHDDQVALEEKGPVSSETKYQELETPVVFQCATCRTIFADTTSGFLQTNYTMETISFTSVRSVELSENIETDTSGMHSNCAFLRMECKQCGQTIGRKFVSTTTDFDDIRGAFTFDKKCLITYRAGSCNPETQNRVEENGVQGSASDLSLAAIRSLQEQLSAVGESVNSLADWMQAMESDKTQLRQDLLAWEERIQRMERVTEQIHTFALKKDLPYDSEGEV